ncbi:MAG TPA: hypothetical protein VJ397_02585 [Thermoplasmata archaeon]|nr:hypothetical protein [Thermoplasmata archaeon]
MATSTQALRGSVLGITPLDEQFLRAALDASERREDPSSQLASDDAIRSSFLNAWDVLRAELHLDLTATQALTRVHDLVVYDIPDGTRSTLSVSPEVPIEQDAALYATQLVHTLRALGARRGVIMVHTAYNRRRGPEETARFLRMIERGALTMIAYSRERGVQLDIVGMGRSYELYQPLRASVPAIPSPAFFAHLLLDYSEESFLTAAGRRALDRLPDIDVCIRHTKLQITGGWIPRRMLRSTYLYSQNGTLGSNWRYDEHAAQVAIALLSKELLSGEVLTKAYRGIDEVKRRHQLREVGLQRQRVTLRPRSRKLFLLSSPYGLVEVLA